MNEMESGEDECSSRVDLTKEDLECIRSLAYIMYFDTIVKDTGNNKLADQVEKLVKTYDRIIDRFNKVDSLEYFFFHFAHNFCDFLFYDGKKNICTDEIFNINKLEDENFNFNTCHVILRVTNKFDSDYSKMFQPFIYPDREFSKTTIVVHYFPKDESDEDYKSACISIFKDPLMINENERIAFLKELYSLFYIKFVRNCFGRIIAGLPMHSPDWSYASSSS